MLEDTHTMIAHNSLARIHRPIALIALAATVASAQSTYYPPRGGPWQTKRAAEVGMDSAKLQAAVDFALANNASWDFDKDQVRTFGRPLGPLPKTRAATNGIILRHGYIVAQF